MKQNQKAHIWIVGVAIIATIGVFQNCSQVNFTQINLASLQGNQDIARVKPSLAVSNGVCVNCHSLIVGNYVSDYTGSPTTNFLGDGSPSGVGDYLGWWSTYGNRFFSGTSFIRGTMIVPKVTLAAITQTAVSGAIRDAKTRTMLDLASDPTLTFSDGRTAPFPAVTEYAANTPENITTVAQFLNAIFNYRTNEFINVISTWGLFPAKTMLPDTQIREVYSVTIGAPDVAMVKSLLPSGQPLSYVPSVGSSVGSLAGFSLGPNGQYYTNSGIVECDGDLIVDKPVFLNSLQLKTETGCRIYSTHTIFVQASDGSVPRNGIQYVGSNPKQNLQLSSAVGISMGVGQCGASNTFQGRASWDSTSLPMILPAPGIATMSPDYALIIDSASNNLILDASPTCGGPNDATRAVSFQHMLINAPRIDSRYTGDFDGVIVTKFLLWSRGMFHFQYDPVFDSVAVLPKIPAASFFAVVDCQTNGVDNAKVLDTKFKSCN